MDSSILWTISYLNFTGIICNYNCSNFIIDVGSGKVYEAIKLTINIRKLLEKFHIYSIECLLSIL